MRSLGFEDLKGALQGLAGSWVGVETSPIDGSAPLITLIGELGTIWLLGESRHRALAFEVGDATVRVGDRSFARAVLEEYVDRPAALRWSLVAIELQLGLVLEVEEVPTTQIA